MKILFVRMAGEVGGAEVYNLNLIRGFKKYFPEVEVFFVTNLPKFARQLDKLGAKTFVLPTSGIEIGTKRDFVNFFPYLPGYLFHNLKTLFKAKKEQISVVCFQGTTEKLILTPIFKIFGLPVIWLEHGPFFAIKKAKIIRLWYKGTSLLASRIITVSEDSKKDLEEKGIRKVVCIQTGMDRERFKGVKEFKKFKDLIVGYAGTICWEKGIRDFVEVAFAITQKRKNVKFLLVGDGPQLAWAKRAVKTLGIEKSFVFTGWQKNVFPYLAPMAVFFFPTLHLEGFSLALLESMGMGIPVVARDIGGNRELVVPGKTGYLFKEESSEEVAEIIANLLKDEKKRREMGKAGQERVEKYFSEERWIRRIYRIFKEVVKK